MIGVDDQILRARRRAVRTARNRKCPGKLIPSTCRPARLATSMSAGEHDGTASAPVEDVVEEAVARILVLSGIADEAQLAEQVVVERHDAGIVVGVDVPRRLAGRRGRARHSTPGCTCRNIQSIEIRGGVERRMWTHAMISAGTAR